jgi:hypothetical protein
MAQQCTGCGRLKTEPLGLNKNGKPYLACCPDNSYKNVSSVEWLFRWHNDNPEATINEGIKAFKQAKEMHKEEHEDTYNEGKLNGFDFEDYYNETFNK